MNDIKNKKIILASKSPRRKELLETAGFETIIVPSEADEDIDEKDPVELVKQLSLIKATSVFESEKSKGNIKAEDIVLGADTVVYAGGSILGKPADKNDARNMIKMLSGNVHSVFTGFTLCIGDGRIITDYSETKVYVYSITDEEVEEYINSDEPYDKAGAYGIQGLFGKFVERIDGDYQNVVGLPVSKIVHSIKKVM